ncbi:probable beta-1,3-galactosyltransferase 14 [Aegilops tauschii subsp. strangulata]|uniref:probable beta-1,3-galactosyltransferase 14 n=1 Tax=Aegilops tauschii subsp. strangulata TaxID=200361 RepID=UPI00098A791A|nr:probable beta-1,3-galactosyltransferase 14 [Aegilops tauschii subsp. strangulata]
MVRPVLPVFPSVVQSQQYFWSCMSGSTAPACTSTSDRYYRCLDVVLPLLLERKYCSKPPGSYRTAHQIRTHRRPRRSSLRRLLSSPAVSAACLLFGLAGFLAAAVSLSRAPAEAPRGRCPDSSHPLSVSVAWDWRPGDAAGGATDLPAGLATGSRGRHKVMAFVGIFTGFGSVGRRRALRRTWLPSDRQGLLRLEEATGLAFRFVIGKSNDKSKMAALEREVEEYDDFVLLDLEEEYSRLPYKTLAFFKAAYALFDSDFYVKADDDIYLRPDRLSLLLAKERTHTQTYIGCMKKGPVFTDPKLNWYEPQSFLLGSEYFLHAYGPIYALSADVVASLVALRNNR